MSLLITTAKSTDFSSNILYYPFELIYKRGEALLGVLLLNNCCISIPGKPGINREMTGKRPEILSS